MAMLKSKQKQQVIAKLVTMAPPGESFITTVHCESGPGYWATVALGELPLVGLIITLLRSYYFLTVTNSHVVVVTASRFRRIPGEFVVAYPLQQLPVSRLVRSRMWSSLYLQLPNEEKPTRLNIGRYWLKEFDMMLHALPQQQQSALEAQAEAAA